MSHEPHVGVVGAGPGGSAAAFALAAAGRRVTLIEQQRFPRDKVCGECLSALGIEALEQLGLAGRILALEPVILRRVILYARDGSAAELELPRPMWGISRLALDAALLEAARAAGATVLQPARCESINGELTIRDLCSNRVRGLRVDWTLLADGKGGLLPQRPAATCDLGIKAHLDALDGPLDAVELFGVDGHYIGLAPIDGGRWNLAFSVPTRKLKRASGAAGEALDGLWRQLLWENPALQKRMKPGRRVSDWQSSPLPRFGVVDAWPDRVIPLGNAAAAIEPIGGEGMGLALWSARAAAEALLQGDGTSNGTLTLRKRFAARWRGRQLACRALARLLSAPSLSPSVVALAAANRPLSRWVMSRMGK